MKFTHSGLINDRGRKTRMLLRETKLYWIRPTGTKYKKRNGFTPGYRYPTEFLELDSIKPLENQE